MLYTHIHVDVSRNITTSVNEWTHFFIKNIPLTLYSRKGWCWLCVRGELEMGTLLHIDPKFFWPQQRLFLVLLNRGSWGPKPSVWSWFSVWLHISNWNCNSNSNWPKPSVAPGYIFVWHPPASCGCTHLHRIQPRPQVKVIFQYLRPDAPVSAVPLLIYTGASLNWWLSRGSICYNS